jgi:PAS domain S-box-containing protein
MKSPAVMVVEDEVVTRLDLIETLKELGYRVIAVASGGEEAIRLAVERRPDVILMDISLKGEIDGIETADRIHADHDIPIIFLTAREDDAVVQRAKRTTPFGYLIKPISPLILRTTLELTLYTAGINQQRLEALTALRQSRQNLQQEKERVRRYLDIAAVIILVLDRHGNIRLINRKGCELLGYDEAEINGRNWFYHFLPASRRRRAETAFKRILTGERTLHSVVESPVLPRQGEQRRIEWHSTPLTDPTGAIVGIISSGLDITERKRTELELTRYREHLEELVVERTRSLERLAGDLRLKFTEQHQTAAALKASLAEQEILLQEVHHRVKNNLFMIVGMLHDERDQAENGGLTQCRSLLDRVTGRVEALFTVHRLLSMRGWRFVELDYLCEQIIEGALKTLRDTTVSVDIVPSTVRVDSRQAHSLTLAISELVVNSLKHAFNALQRLHIGIEISRQGEQVTLRYRDNGPGYPPSVIAGKPSAGQTGLELIDGIIGHNLRGSVTLENDFGAVTTIAFPRQT